MQCNERGRHPFPRLTGAKSDTKVRTTCCVVRVWCTLLDSPALPAEGQVPHRLPTCTPGRGRPGAFPGRGEEDFGRRAAAGAVGASASAQKRRQAQAASESEEQGKQSPYFPGVFRMPWLLSSSHGEPSHPPSHPPQEEASEFTNDDTSRPFSHTSEAGLECEPHSHCSPSPFSATPRIQAKDTNSAETAHDINSQSGR